MASLSCLALDHHDPVSTLTRRRPARWRGDRSKDEPQFDAQSQFPISNEYYLFATRSDLKNVGGNTKVVKQFRYLKPKG